MVETWVETVSAAERSAVWVYYHVAAALLVEVEAVPARGIVTMEVEVFETGGECLWAVSLALVEVGRLRKPTEEAQNVALDSAGGYQSVGYADVGISAAADHALPFLGEAAAE